MTEGWLLRLKTAYEAGYYQTEVDADEQTSFPWQDRYCRDCPFYVTNDICQVDLMRCSGEDVPCRYSDPQGQEEARALIERRLWSAWRRHRQPE